MFDRPQLGICLLAIWCGAFLVDGQGAGRAAGAVDSAADHGGGFVEREAAEQPDDLSIDDEADRDVPPPAKHSRTNRHVEAAADEPLVHEQPLDSSRWGPLSCRLVVRQAVARPHEHAAVLTCVALDPEGTLAAAGGDDHHVRLWSTADGRLVAVLRGHEDWVRACMFEPDGTGLLTCGDDRALYRWDLRTCEPRLVARQTAPAYALVLLPERGLAAAAGFEPKVWLHSFATEQASAWRVAPCPDIRALALSPDGQLLAAAGRCGTVRIWRTDTWQATQDLKNAARRIRGLAFSPHGELLAAAGDGEQIVVWETQRWTVARALEARPGKALSLVFCDAETLAVGGSHNDIRLWNVLTGELVQRLEGHSGSVAGLAWHAASGLLASASYDTTLRLWRKEGAPPQVARTPAAAGR